MEYKNGEELIVRILNSKLEKKIEEYQYFHIGKLFELPNQCGCFKKKSQWYIYSYDEKKCAITGPFNLNGIIYACAKLLHVTKLFKEYQFLGKERDIYINHNFHTPNKIENLN